MGADVTSAPQLREEARKFVHMQASIRVGIEVMRKGYLTSRQCRERAHVPSEDGEQAASLAIPRC